VVRGTFARAGRLPQLPSMPKRGNSYPFTPSDRPLRNNSTVLQFVKQVTGMICSSLAFQFQ